MWIVFQVPWISWHWNFVAIDFSRRVRLRRGCCFVDGGPYSVYESLCFDVYKSYLQIKHFRNIRLLIIHTSNWCDNYDKKPSYDHQYGNERARADTHKQINWLKSNPATGTSLPWMKLLSLNLMKYSSHWNSLNSWAFKIHNVDINVICNLTGVKIWRLTGSSELRVELHFFSYRKHSPCPLGSLMLFTEKIDIYCGDLRNT